MVSLWPVSIIKPNRALLKSSPLSAQLLLLALAVRHDTLLTTE